MNSTTSDAVQEHGGPAFPFPLPGLNCSERYFSEVCGMSLRDVFATVAMWKFLDLLPIGDPGVTCDQYRLLLKAMGDGCYVAADAMLIAREQEDP